MPTDYVWHRNDDEDHLAGHPSGYDCEGYAISTPREVCSRPDLDGGR